MIFSSTEFLVVFFPIILAVYFISGRRNGVLLIASILFYASGEKYFTFLLIISIGFNYTCGILIDRACNQKRAVWVLFAGISCNLLFLFFFKYFVLFIDTINFFLKQIGMQEIIRPDIHLPLGISFFTFQAITYLVDLWRGQVRVQKNLIQLGLYISLFPQLVAGPIVRYHEIFNDLKERYVNYKDIFIGTERFVLGFAKKVLIADTLAVSAEAVFLQNCSDLAAPVAWFGALCFMMQIYYDFSGYSDMGIGLGQIFGFHFPENFNFPYAAKSITEFWRRWHITLSRFFKDYLYIPLGGNRNGRKRMFINLWFVFILCGLWHGANWTYILWGCYHGFFLVFERTRLGRVILYLPKVIKYLYMFLVVLVGWVIFRADSVEHAFGFLGSMFSWNGWEEIPLKISAFANPFQLSILFVSLFFSLPLLQICQRIAKMKMASLSINNDIRRTFFYIREICYGTILCSLFLIAFSAMAAQTHRAFIYFRF